MESHADEDQREILTRFGVKRRLPGCVRRLQQDVERRLKSVIQLVHARSCSDEREGGCLLALNARHVQRCVAADQITCVDVTSGLYQERDQARVGRNGHVQQTFA